MSKRRKCESVYYIDLPDDVVCNILSFLPMWYVSQINLPYSMLKMIVNMQMIEASVEEKIIMLLKVQNFKFICSNCEKCKDIVKFCSDCGKFFCVGDKECDVFEYCNRCKKSYCYYCRGAYGYGPPNEYPDGHSYCEKCNAYYYGNGVGSHHAYTKPKLK